ncbi:hypothetical protein GMRT_13103 [Giardia muris]|uniref:Uncharacterized protein n=1 Tax=Giardia muris TaxID=5742 RepID=A0A4Z1SXL4_GIAMU|nr:hypothetical protein GMRT_13103 [Giardia muris]|eukprot:TNJ30512.1 hypothetical protein GMRT_13103 [Giardia muris]
MDPEVSTRSALARLNAVHMSPIATILFADSSAINADIHRIVSKASTVPQEHQREIWEYLGGLTTFLEPVCDSSGKEMLLELVSAGLTMCRIRDFNNALAILHSVERSLSNSPQAQTLVSGILAYCYACMWEYSLITSEYGLWYAQLTIQYAFQALMNVRGDLESYHMIDSIQAAISILIQYGNLHEGYALVLIMTDVLYGLLDGRGSLLISNLEEERKIPGPAEPMRAPSIHKDGFIGEQTNKLISALFEDMDTASPLRESFREAMANIKRFVEAFEPFSTETLIRGFFRLSFIKGLIEARFGAYLYEIQLPTKEVQGKDTSRAFLSLWEGLRGMNCVISNSMSLSVLPIGSLLGLCTDITDNVSSNWIVGWLQALQKTNCVFLENKECARRIGFDSSEVCSLCAALCACLILIDSDDETQLNDNIIDALSMLSTHCTDDVTIILLSLEFIHYHCNTILLKGTPGDLTKVDDLEPHELRFSFLFHKLSLLVQSDDSMISPLKELLNPTKINCIRQSLGSEEARTSFIRYTRYLWLRLQVVIDLLTSVHNRVLGIGYVPCETPSTLRSNFTRTMPSLPLQRFLIRIMPPYLGLLT